MPCQAWHVNAREQKAVVAVVGIALSLYGMCVLKFWGGGTASFWQQLRWRVDLVINLNFGLISSWSSHESWFHVRWQCKSLPQEKVYRSIWSASVWVCVMHQVGWWESMKHWGHSKLVVNVHAHMHTHTRSHILAHHTHAPTHPHKIITPAALPPPPPPPSPVFSFGIMIATFVVLIALIFKRHDAPSNYYLLLTFVSSCYQAVILVGTHNSIYRAPCCIILLCR